MDFHSWDWMPNKHRFKAHTRRTVNCEGKGCMKIWISHFQNANLIKLIHWSKFLFSRFFLNSLFPICFLDVRQVSHTLYVFNVCFISVKINRMKFSSKKSTAYHSFQAVFEQRTLWNLNTEKPKVRESLTVWDVLISNVFHS